MQKGRILGLDFGLKRIGFAISDFEHKLALPIGFVENKSRENALAELRGICEKYAVNLIVLGAPTSLMAKDTAILNKIKDFGKILSERLNVKIDFIDERFTSVEAGKILHTAGMKEKQQRSVKDAVSAGILLQTYLDRLNAKRC